jgi:hypothetical protein
MKRVSSCPSSLHHCRSSLRTPRNANGLCGLISSLPPRTSPPVSSPLSFWSSCCRSDVRLWPLLKKDGLVLQYVIFLPLWVYLAYESLPTHPVTKTIHLVPNSLKHIVPMLTLEGLPCGLGSGTNRRGTVRGSGEIPRYLRFVECHGLLGLFFRLLGVACLVVLEG